VDALLLRVILALLAPMRRRSAERLHGLQAPRPAGQICRRGDDLLCSDRVDLRAGGDLRAAGADVRLVARLSCRAQGRRLVRAL
jgi:hypothetical protein